MLPRPRLLMAALFAVALSACERERVEVAESNGDAGATPTPNDAASPFLPIVDGGEDGRPTCGPPPPIHRCAPCPFDQFVSLDDGGTECECCP